MTFSDRLIERAQKIKKRIVLPEGFDTRVVQAAGLIQQRGIADVTLLADPSNVKELAAGVDISAVEIVDIKTSEKKEKYRDLLLELRKDKGMTKEQADTLVLNELYFGVLMVKAGDADGMVGGAANATGDLIRPALQIIRTKEGISTASAFFVMTVPDSTKGYNGTFIFADSGLVMNPTAEELANIAVVSAESGRLLCEMEPIVAMLSFSTKGSAHSEDVQKVIDATKLAKELSPGLKLDGELQADAALVPKIAKSKAPNSVVQGDANVLVFPNLDAGNIGYKLVQRLANAEALGPVLQGLAKPVNDLSRGCSVDDIVKVAAITVLQANV